MDLRRTLGNEAPTSAQVRPGALAFWILRKDLGRYSVDSARVNSGLYGLIYQFCL